MFTVCGAPDVCRLRYPHPCEIAARLRKSLDDADWSNPPSRPDGAFATPPTNSSPSARSRDGVEAEGRRADEPLAIGLLEWPTSADGAGAARGDRQRATPVSVGAGRGSDGWLIS
jgi:hypothetical protein